MKIIDSRKAKAVITFANIKMGECFIDDDGDVIMKVEEWANNNAIDMRTGAAYFFDGETEVIPIKTSLTIYE